MKRFLVLLSFFVGVFSKPEGSLNFDSDVIEPVLKQDGDCEDYEIYPDGTDIDTSVVCANTPTEQEKCLMHCYKMKCVQEALKFLEECSLIDTLLNCWAQHAKYAEECFETTAIDGDCEGLIDRL